MFEKQQPLSELVPFDRERRLRIFKDGIETILTMPVGSFMRFDYEIQSVSAPNGISAVYRRSEDCLEVRTLDFVAVAKVVCEYFDGNRVLVYREPRPNRLVGVYIANGVECIAENDAGFCLLIRPGEDPYEILRIERPKEHLQSMRS